VRTIAKLSELQDPRSTLGNVIFFFVVIVVILGFATLRFLGERTASNAPVETTVGQSRPPAAQ
jgi:hypothetical protein